MKEVYVVKMAKFRHPSLTNRSPYNRKPKGSQDKVICLLENGWLKESPKRIKFYNSVKKGLDLMTIDHVMKRELKTAMKALLGDKLMELMLEEDDVEQ